MLKKNWLLIFIALALAGVYVFYFTDWFTPKIIHIKSTNARSTRLTRAGRDGNNPGFLSRLNNLANSANSAANNDAPTISVIFQLGRPCKLTDLKVIDLDEWQTNKNCLPIWHLVADTNSVPIARPFNYGQRLLGMKPAVPGALAEPLEPGVKYRIFVTDGSAKGQHDFQTIAKPPAPPGQ
jgi:hypothetical protein